MSFGARMWLTVAASEMAILRGQEQWRGGVQPPDIGVSPALLPRQTSLQLGRDRRPACLMHDMAEPCRDRGPDRDPGGVREWRGCG